MKINLLIFIVILPALCFAQFDDKASGEDSSGFSEMTDGAAGDSDSESESVGKNNVSSADIKKLADAKKSKSEAAIVDAAAHILSQDPNHLVALNTLGLHYYESKKFGLAKIIFKRALKTSPKEPALYNNLAIIYLSENDVRLALEFFKKSTDMRSNYKIGATNLSSIYLEYGDFKRSLAPLEEAYKATRSDLRRGDSNSVDIANNYAVALIGVGEDGKASDIYEKIYEANVRNPVPYLNYAILLVEVQKKKKDAFRVLSKLKFMTEDKDILRQVDELEKKLE